MRCPSCQAENPERGIICKECGRHLQPPVPPSDNERARQFLEEAFRLSDEGKLGQAIATCKQAIAANPDSTSAYSLLGILYERAGQRELAIQAYEAALRLSPESVADRVSQQQLISPPPVAELPVERAPAPPPPPAVPAPPLRERRRWALAPIWYGVAATAVILILLLVFTVHAWRAASRQPEAAAPAAAPPAPRVVARPPAPPARVPMEPAPALARPTMPPPRAPEAPTPRAPLGAGVTVRAAPEATPPGPAAAPPEPSTIPAPEWALGRASVRPTPQVPPASYAAPPAPVTPEAARTRYFEGDLAGAIDVYERVIADTPQVSAVTYQDVGWLYYQAGRLSDAAAAYRQGLERYRQQLAADQDVEAARHGIRTSEAALRVLELE